MTADSARLRVAVLISGRGSNMAALAEAARSPDYPAEVALVVSNRPDALGLDRARALGLAALVVDHRTFPERESFERALDERLVEGGVELVCLAGFMRVLTPWFVGRWAGRILNVHPSLLPLFRGRDPHAQALAAGVRIHGCTAHFVVPEVDAGPIIAQAAVAVEREDTSETLAARLLPVEHLLYPMALALVASGRARLDGERVVLDAGLRMPDAALVVPAG